MEQLEEAAGSWMEDTFINLQRQGVFQQEEA
jgi:hypothetical protein